MHTLPGNHPRVVPGQRGTFLFVAVLAALFSSCTTPPPAWEELPMDPHSFSEPNRVRVRHVDLDLSIDFDTRLVQGTAALTLDRIDPDAPLVVDTHELDVHSVTVDGNDRSHQFGEGRKGIGRPLTIELEPGDQTVTVAYTTAPGAEALQWLEPDQTAGGTQPFLFTQGQSIFTRSWIPLQDSPGVRITYTAKIRAPDDLTVVMSAAHEGKKDGVWHFRLDQAVPAYLLALACGDLERREISNRCAVWAEPSLVDAAADEFADTEKMVQSCEGLFGPYRWERYDVLILPPSFPFGGMENPRLTFLTPTVLAGDRSLVSIIAHELAHSWSGNLVTNATWSDFWLNEGFTVYCEKRIMEVLYGAERAAMEKMLDRADLLREMEDLEDWQTVLHTNLESHHPDDGFSAVPYDKGALFLRRLEAEVGREAFDAFLTGWFNEHAFQSVTTQTFLDWLRDKLPAAANAVDLDEWIHQPGLPADAPRTESDALEVVEAEVARLLDGTAPGELVTHGWVTQQWLHFLNSLPADLGVERMAALDETFALRNQGNSEILFAWLKLGIQQGYAANRPVLEDFLLRVGRRKFVKPLYEELAKTEEGKAFGREVYPRAQKGYHAWTRKGCEEALGLRE